jgi:hypothetical protein
VAEENVEAARRLTEAVQRGDYRAAAAELDSEIEIDDTDIPESTGADSFYTWMARWDESRESWRMEDLEIRPVGEDVTVSLFRMIVKGKGSGIELTREDAVVAEHRAGKVVRLGYYNDQAKAIAAAAG